MKIALACDHAGFQLKKFIIDSSVRDGCEYLDLGTHTSRPVDYPDFALKAARIILGGEADRGILICGSGIGACIAANKIKGIYAGVCHDTYSAHQGVEHDDMNMLCLGARIIGPDLAREIIFAYLHAHFIGDEPGQQRHRRRVDKTRIIERQEL